MTRPSIHLPDYYGQKVRVVFRDPVGVSLLHTDITRSTVFSVEKTSSSTFVARLTYGCDGRLLHTYTSSGQVWPKIEGPCDILSITTINEMQPINLEKFVGAKVDVMFSNDRLARQENMVNHPYFTLERTDDPNRYPYKLVNPEGKLVNTYTKRGKVWYSGNESRYDIARISAITTLQRLEPVNFEKFGQARPSIDLEEFVDKEVYVKCNCAQTGGNSFSNRMIARVRKGTDGLGKLVYVIQGNYYNADGRRSSDPNSFIEEIYPAGAFKIFTAPTKPAKSDAPEVEAAKKALEKLTPEQVAALWSTMTGAGE